MKRLYCLMGAVGLILLLSGTAMGTEDACRWEPPDHVAVSAPEPVSESGDRGTYTGIIRVYVLEKIGRWYDSQGIAYHNALLAFALQESISLAETDTLTWELEWDGHDYHEVNGQSYDDIQENNIKVIAAVFNSSSYTGYSDPPSGAPFAVHEVDATAGATSGTTGYNEETESFTHSVLVEDGSTTW